MISVQSLHRFHLDVSDVEHCSEAGGMRVNFDEHVCAPVMEISKKGCAGPDRPVTDSHEMVDIALTTCQKSRKSVLSEFAGVGAEDQGDERAPSAF
jgi:hypothetical protein